MRKIIRYFVSVCRFGAELGFWPVMAQERVFFRYCNGRYWRKRIILLGECLAQVISNNSESEVIKISANCKKPVTLLFRMLLAGTWGELSRLLLLAVYWYAKL